MNQRPALRPGDRGPLVEDLQQRLTGVGHGVADTEIGTFGPETEAAVRAFQRSRMLVIDGVCGPDTWSALVECGYALGDRILYLRQPMLRGDDVAELQATLNALGFHAGRQDGIFGPQTERGLREFQRNMGLATDGQVGPATRAELHRLSTFAEGSVESVREREALRSGSWRLERLRVFVAVPPELAVVGNAVHRELRTHASSVVVDASGSSDHELAQRANRFEATLTLALRLGDDEARLHYFASPTHRSEVGHCVASSLATALEDALGPNVGYTTGRRTTLLRETRMPAVVCILARPGAADEMRLVTAQAPEIATAIAHAIAQALDAPAV